MKRRKRIALYGGTFDPVHRGHLAIAERLTELFTLDELLFIPAFVAPHKREVKVTPALHRYAMLVLSTLDKPRFLVSTVELDNTERPYTVDTLTRFKSELVDEARFFFVMGADSWRDIATWREWQRVLEMVDTIVVTRPGYELSFAHVTAQVQKRIVDLRQATAEQVEQQLTESNEATIYMSDAVMMNVSATAVRRQVREGTDLTTSVVPAVAEYINKYKLYQDEHETESLSTSPNTSNDRPTHG